MQVGWEELQREVGARRHKSLLEGNQYKQDQNAGPEHKLCSPSFIFHIRETSVWSQCSQHSEKEGEKTRVIIFSIWSIELRTSDFILPTLAVGILGNRELTLEMTERLNEREMA